MKKALLLALLVTTNLYAVPLSLTKDCLMALSKNDSESALYIVDHEDVWGPDHLASSIRAIRKLSYELGCEHGDLNFGRGPEGRSHSDCNQLAGTRLNSVVCYVESNLGYFIVNRTYNDKLNVLFNHWD